jgi:hypothetical protein
MWLQGRCPPADAPALSWESVLFQLTRWPWVLLGVAHATIGHLLDREFEFRVSPKAMTEATPLGTRVVLPYTVMVALQASVLTCVADAERALGTTGLA